MGRALVKLLFHGKRLFPSPADLKEAGFLHPIMEFDLSAGECLVAGGGWAHWGVNQDDDTFSLATNFTPESWLKVRATTILPSACEYACLSRVKICAVLTLGCYALHFIFRFPRSALASW